MAAISFPLSRWSFALTRRQRRLARRLVATGFTLALLSFFLMPLAYSASTSLKNKTQISKAGGPWWPASERTIAYEGKPYDVYLVPTEEGVKEWALVKKGREESWFVDPERPEAGLIEWQGRWRTLERVWAFDVQWHNYRDAWQKINFPRLLRNTLMYAILSTIGAVFSAALVAYGFARFRFPRRDLLFIIVMATIILPPAVTLVPTYAFFNKIGWVGTWLPLIVPAYFANGYNIFLLRQFFLTIPREMDESALIDGASYPRIFWHIILPQSIPALTAVTLFHFFYAWNDFFLPLIYLAGKPELQPITVGLTNFRGIYDVSPHLIQAASLIASAIPLVIFFFAQRAFMQGVVISGVEK